MSADYMKEGCVGEERRGGAFVLQYNPISKAAVNV